MVKVLSLSVSSFIFNVVESHKAVELFEVMRYVLRLARVFNAVTIMHFTEGLIGQFGRCGFVNLMRIFEFMSVCPSPLVTFYIVFI